MLPGISTLSHEKSSICHVLSIYAVAWKVISFFIMRLYHLGVRIKRSCVRQQRIFFFLVFSRKPIFSLGANNLRQKHKKMLQKSVPVSRLNITVHTVLCKSNENEIREFRRRNCELSFQTKKRRNFGPSIVRTSAKFRKQGDESQRISQRNFVPAGRNFASSTRNFVQARRNFVC